MNLIHRGGNLWLKETQGVIVSRSCSRTRKIRYQRAAATEGWIGSLLHPSGTAPREALLTAALPHSKKVIHGKKEFCLEGGDYDVLTS